MFERNADAFSPRDQLRLYRSCAAVCGLGGGGGYVAEVLARAGMGRLILIDGDVFEDSNRNRQLGALGSTLGRLKVDVMAERLADANPYLRVEAHPVFLGPDSADLLAGADVVCDCVDGRANKALLAGICRERGLPCSTGGLSGRRFHAAMFGDPALAADLYASPGEGRSLQADQAALLCCAGLQAGGVLDFLLGRDKGALNRVITMNLSTMALAMKDLPRKATHA